MPTTSSWRARRFRRARPWPKESSRPGRIPPGHKVAVRAISEGEPVFKYNQIIGFATRPIAPGEHVHVHNMGMGEFAKDYAYGEGVRPTDYFAEPATFQGIVRPDGRVATRNYIGILTSVNCSAHTAGTGRGRLQAQPFHRLRAVG